MIIKKPLSQRLFDVTHFILGVAVPTSLLAFISYIANTTHAFRQLSSSAYALSNYPFLAVISGKALL